MKQLTQYGSYNINGWFHDYIVVMERLHNDENGNPRWKATLVSKDEKQQGSLYSAAYSFKGHFYNEKGEAAWIVSEHEERLLDQSLKEAKAEAGWREKYALEAYKNGNAQLEISRGEGYCHLRFVYDSRDEYQDANGATYDRERGHWVG